VDERILYAERLWYPTRPFALLLGFAYLAGIAIGLIGHADTTGWILYFAVATLGTLGWAAWFKLAYRRLYTRVGVDTLEVGRNNRVPRTSIREPRIVSGAELKQLRSELRQGSSSFNATRSPKLRGLVTIPGVKTALWFRVEPPIHDTAVFIVSTCRPDELLAALTDTAPTEAAEPTRALG
jgi:hypothetical protein